MPIENRNLTKGTKLTGRYHKQSYSCEVVENAEGKLRYRLEDGREFKSPSAAGMAITGHACDGWVFWSVQTEETTTKPAAEKEETKAAPAVDANQAKEPVAPDPKKTGVFLVPESEGCAGRPDSLVLPGLRQELHCLGSRSAGGLPQPSSQLKPTEKRITLVSRLPIMGACLAW